MGKAAREARRVSQRAHEAMFGVFCPGMLEVLSIGRGDLKLTLDGSSPEDMARARQVIEEMLRKGYGIYVETEHGPIRVRQFNPETMTYMIVDDPPATTVEEDEAGEQLPPAEKAKRPAKKRALREVPVAGSRATAVGRTAGG